jgi:integrase
MAALAADASIAAPLLRFIVLTAARYSEAALADWQEIDFDQATWTIPSDRTKTGEAYIVPLSNAALAVLETVRGGSNSLIFPGDRPGKPISTTLLLKTIRRHTDLPATTHGMRSALRDWAGDETGFDRQTIEFALAHGIDDETEAAYRRSTAIKKRRELMEVWANYCRGEDREC